MQSIPKYGTFLSICYDLAADKALRAFKPEFYANAMGIC
jgi:hypothetical protein